MECTSLMTTRLNCGTLRNLALQCGRTRRSKGYPRLTTSYVTRHYSSPFLLLTTYRIPNILHKKFLLVPSCSLPRNFNIKILQAFFVFPFRRPSVVHRRSMNLASLAINTKRPMYSTKFLIFFYVPF